MAEHAIALRLRLGYALCNVGLTLGQVPINLLLLYYLTEIAGLPAGLAGLAVALPKIWDALVDPMFGGWLDRLSMRLGRRTPVLLVSSAVFLATLVLIFALPALDSPLAVLALASLLLILSSTAQTGIGVSQYALATEMTANSTQLSALLALAAIIAQIFSVAGAALVPLLIPWAGGGRIGYAGMALAVAVVAGVALLLFILAMRRVPVRAAGPETLSLPASIRATIGNRAFYYLMAFVLCVNGSIAVLLAILPFANQYVLGGDQASLSLLEAVLGVTVLAGMALATPLLRRLSPLGAMRFSNLGVALLSAALFAAGYGPIWLSWLALAGLGIGSGVVGVLVQTALLNAAQHGLPGKPVALGFYLGIMLAATKLGASMGNIVSGELLDLSGFVPGGAMQSATALFGLRAGYSLVPLAFIIVAGLFLQRVRLPQNGEAAEHPREELRELPCA